MSIHVSIQLVHHFRQVSLVVVSHEFIIRLSRLSTLYSVVHRTPLYGAAVRHWRETQTSFYLFDDVRVFVVLRDFSEGKDFCVLYLLQDLDYRIYSHATSVRVPELLAHME